MNFYFLLAFGSCLSCISAEIANCHQFQNETLQELLGHESETKLKVLNVVTPTCPAETIVTMDVGNFEFPSTPATSTGNLVKLPCPFSTMNTGAETLTGSGSKDTANGGGVRVCYSSEGIGIWGALEHTNCRPKTMADMIVRVKTILINSPAINVYNIRQLLPLLNILFVNAIRDYESAEVLVEAVNRVLEDPELYGDEDDTFMSFVRQTMFGFLQDYTKLVNLAQGQRVQVRAKDLLVETAIFPDDDQNYSYSIDSFQLSNEAIRLGKTGRLKVQAFSDDLFFHWGKQRDWAGENETDVNNGTELEFTGAWRIYSVEFQDADVANLSIPVSYSFTLNDSSEYRWLCAYWDTTALAWSTIGMKTLKIHNTIRCESTHLTAFSALIDPVPKDGPRDTNDAILSILSTVLSAFSITGLAATLLTYMLFRKLRRERSNQIVLNLTLALLLLHTFLLSSSKALWNSFCLIPGLLLHFALLASFAWMFCYGMHLYKILVCVFVQPETRFIVKRCALAWGVPILVVVLTVLIDSDVYKEGKGTDCVFGGQVNLGLYYGLYLSPLILILAANTFAFLRIILILVHQSSRQKKQMRSVSDPRDRVPNFLSPIQIRGTITLFILLGTGWIVGLLALGPFELVFRYAYVILNGGQGMMIFLFRVLLDPNAMSAWRRTVMSSDSEMSFTTSSNKRSGNRKSAPYTISPTFISSATNSAENSVTPANPLQAHLAQSLFSIIHASPETPTTKEEEAMKNS